jgi:membrane-bound acyltransferase YfiQ involved in biofilm formation
MKLDTITTLIMVDMMLLIAMTWSYFEHKLLEEKDFLSNDEFQIFMLHKKIVPIFFILILITSSLIIYKLVK